MSDRESAMGIPPEAIRKEFAKRLQAALNDKGWNQAELARRVAKLLPDRRIGRDNISKYVRGIVLPLPFMLAAICKVLEMESRDLLPARMTRASTEEQSPVRVRDLDGDRAWVDIRISREMPWSTVLKLLALLKGSE